MNLLLQNFLSILNNFCQVYYKINKIDHNLNIIYIIHNILYCKYNQNRLIPSKMGRLNIFVYNLCKFYKILSILYKFHIIQKSLTNKYIFCLQFSYFEKYGMININFYFHKFYIYYYNYNKNHHHAPHPCIYIFY